MTTHAVLDCGMIGYLRVSHNRFQGRTTATPAEYANMILFVHKPRKTHGSLFGWGTSDST